MINCCNFCVGYDPKPPIMLCIAAKQRKINPEGLKSQLLPLQPVVKISSTEGLMSQ